jgi:hypothetical protein
MGLLVLASLWMARAPLLLLLMWCSDECKLAAAAAVNRSARAAKLAAAVGALALVLLHIKEATLCAPPRCAAALAKSAPPSAPTACWHANMVCSLCLL